jgi:hypothetical protein
LARVFFGDLKQKLTGRMCMPIRRDGLVTTGTRQNLIDGLRNRPMDSAAVDRALGQAVEFSQRFVDAYEVSVAQGEVGENGSGRASDQPILANRSPNVLLYGRVQSGKTVAMILTAALCLDNGFRVIVVLTSDNLVLVEQTASRFRALSGPRVFSTRRLSDRYEWEGLEDDIRAEIARDGIVLVSAKNDIHLGRIMAFLQEIDAPSYPALIFDDEADAATPDTTIKAREDGRDNAPSFASAINRRVFENPKPGQEGESLGEIFPHSLYVPVTATPFILFLQRPNSPTRPGETMLLEPGDGYCGGELFFEGFDPSDAGEPPPPLVFVPPTELQSIGRRAIPTGLANSIDYFLVAAVSKADVDGGWPNEGFKHLSHSSPSIGDHAIVVSYLGRHLAEIRRRLRGDVDLAIEYFTTAYGELRRTISNPPALDSLIPRLRSAVEQQSIIVYNSATELPQAPGPRVNFLVGGNILGRGLTIDDLLVTYYVREAKVSQMDTIWQHARMYGYRNDLMPYTRVYVPRRVATNFRRIHDAEERLRDQLRRDPQGQSPVIWVPRGTRATRPNALPTGYLEVVPSGTAQIHPARLCDAPELAMEILTILRREGVPVGLNDRNGRLTSVPFDVTMELVNMIPLVDNDPGDWNSDAVAEILLKYREDLGDFGNIYVRLLNGNPERSRARLSGPEVTTIRRGAGEAPTLVLLYQGDPERPMGWYPTLVMPANSPGFIFGPADE